MVDPQPSIYIGNILVQEPVTVVTDLLVSAVCFYVWRKTAFMNHLQSVYFFRWFFLLMGIATIFGGIAGHAFSYALGFKWKVPGWLLSMISVALAERGAIMHARPMMKRHFGNFFSILNIVELLVFMFVAVYTLNFYFVEIHATYGMLVIVCSFEWFVFIRTRNRGSRQILFGILLAAVAGLVHIYKFAPHTWFNHLDVGHVLMAGSVYLIYRGVLLFK